MVDNTDEEHLDNPIFNQSENMEVHHHAHDPASPHPKKSWKSYIWEFLMLFLAVFCGFLAEYKLEHMIEDDRERVYIQSMIEDLEADTSNLSETISQFNSFERYSDTVLAMYPKLAIGYNDTLFRNLFFIRGYPDFLYTDRTMQQLKNSGNMRLIRCKAAADGIMDYDLKIRDIITVDQPSLQYVFESYNRVWNEMIDIEAIVNDRRILSASEMEKKQKTYLLKTDKPSLGNLNNTIRDFKYVSIELMQKKEIKLKEEAIQLIALLKKEYDLK